MSSTTTSMQATSRTPSPSLYCDCGQGTNHAGINPEYDPSFIQLVNTLWHRLQEVNKTLPHCNHLKIGTITVLTYPKSKMTATVEILRSADLNSAQILQLHPSNLSKKALLISWKAEYCTSSNYMFTFVKNLSK